MKNLFLLVVVVVPLTLLAQPKTYTIIFLNKKPDAEKIDDEASKKLMEDHMANLNRLASEGKLVAAGPLMGAAASFSPRLC